MPADVQEGVNPVSGLNWIKVLAQRTNPKKRWENY
jgi:hypothetical protein